MPTLQGSKKSQARKSRETDMLSDIENMDIMLGSNHFEREESEHSNSVPRPESPSYNALSNHDLNSHSNSRENESRGFTGNGQNSREVHSNSEINETVWGIQPRDHSKK